MQVQGRAIRGVLRIEYGPDRQVHKIEAQLTGSIFRENEAWVAYCIELDISSCGESSEEAGRNLHEAVQLFFETCIEQGTLEAALSELGWVCRTPDEKLVECTDVRLPWKKLPAFMIDQVSQGTDWHARLKVG